MLNNLQKKSFKIVENFKYFIIVSLAIILVGAVFMAARGGMNIGLDFTGGAKIEIELGAFADDAAVQEKVSDYVTKFLEEEKKYDIEGAMTASPSSDGGITYEFRLNYSINGKKLSTKEEEADFLADIQGDLSDDSDNGVCGEIQTKLVDYFNTEADLRAKGASIEDDAVRAYSVGETASSALLRNAIIALAVAIVAMLIYIVCRFTLSSALAAIVALSHDVLIMVALTAIFNVPVNSTFIAAVITIVGYSINATIVIFDRIRECTKLDSFKTMPDADIANYCIKKTINRTLFSSLTTLVMVLLLVFISVPAIQEFIIPIVFGIVAGAYSSVCLASSFWCIFRKVGAKRKARLAKKA